MHLMTMRQKAAAAIAACPNNPLRPAHPKFNISNNLHMQRKSGLTDCSAADTLVDGRPIWAAMTTANDSFLRSPTLGAMCSILHFGALLALSPHLAPRSACKFV